MSKRIILILILILASILRFYKVSEYPVSLYWDEVAIGYNAYSIFSTGKDEYGQFLPITFESFQDSKLPGYIYLTSLSELIFGVNELGVRFPSAIFGIISVYLVFLITKRLFVDKSLKLPFIAALFMSVSPWALQFSRVGFEANSALTLSLLGIYLYLKYLYDSKFFYLSIFVISLSFYFYYQQWIFFPLFVLTTLILLRNKLKLDFKKYTIGGILFFILTFPLTYSFFISGTQNRLSHVENVFNNPNVIKESIEKRVNEDNQLVGALIYNRHLVRVKAFLRFYFEHFSPIYLFFEGDANPRHMSSDTGMSYIFMLPLFVLGLAYIIVKTKNERIIILTWLALSPISASISTPVPHALRSLLMLPVVEIIYAVGLYWLVLKFMKDYKTYIAFTILLITIFIYWQFYYLQSYYLNSKTDSIYWADGHKQLYTYLSKQSGSYENIYITGKYWRPYLFMLFYTKYNPNEYYKNVQHNKISNYYFGHASYDTSNPRYRYNSFDFKKLKSGPNNLIVLAPDELEEIDKNNVVHTIYSASGNPIFYILKSSPIVE